MGLLNLFRKQKPNWFDGVRDYCGKAGIEILAWGPETIVVEAKSPERRGLITAQLADFGFKPIEDEGDSSAGLLTLSRNPFPMGGDPR